MSLAMIDCDNDLVQSIDTLDLEAIKLKLMDEEQGEGWTLEYADQVEKEYKQFLFLAGKYPDAVLVPSKQVDQFWHQHILDTSKYQNDCIKILGKFLHHFPYSGMNGEEDKSNHAQNTEKTKELYQQHFFKVSNSEMAFCDKKPRPSCGATCSCSGPSCNSKYLQKQQIRPSITRKQSLDTKAWRHTV